MAGLAVMLLLIPLNSRILSHTKALQTRVMKVTDNRVKVLSEIINGIKVSVSWCALRRTERRETTEKKLMQGTTTLQSYDAFRDFKACGYI